MTKRIAVLGALAALVLAGCSSAPSTSKESAVSLVTSGVVALNAAKVMAILEGLSYEDKEWIFFEVSEGLGLGIEDSEKRGAAMAVCEQFDRGWSWSDLEGSIIGYTAEVLDAPRASPLFQRGVALGVMVYCPEYMASLPPDWGSP